MYGLIAHILKVSFGSMTLKYPIRKTSLRQQDLFIERGQDIFSKAEILAVNWSSPLIIYFNTIMDDGLGREGKVTQK